MRTKIGTMIMIPEEIYKKIEEYGKKTGISVTHFLVFGAVRNIEDLDSGRIDEREFDKIVWEKIGKYYKFHRSPFTHQVKEVIK